MFKKSELLEIFRNMIRIRRFEEEASRLYKEGLVTGSLHPYIGEEAIAATAAQLMKPGDMLTSTHRGLGHSIVKGPGIKSLMAEIFGRATGCCGGKGGSMHIFDPDNGNLGTNGVVGGGTPIAVGAALTAKELKHNDSVVFCFFGEGASNQGVTHESMNMAAVWKLPVIFVCENNLYQVFTSWKESCSVADISVRARGYSMPGTNVDGNDVLAIAEAYTGAIARARKGEGPSLVECKTYRWDGHWPGDVYSYGGYRSKQEVDEWKEKCPIRRLEEYLLKENIALKNELQDIKKQVDQEIDEAIQFAKDSPEPEPCELMRNIFI